MKAMAICHCALVSFCDWMAIPWLARDSGMTLEDLWALARRQLPIPRLRLFQHGELLQVPGDTLLQENAIVGCSRQSTSWRSRKSAG